MITDIILFIFLGLILRSVFVAIGLTTEKIEHIRDRINHSVFYYIIPFICFKTTYTMPFSTEHLKISIVANLTILSSLLFSWLIYKLISKKRAIKPEIIGSLLMCSSFGNVLYIGLPILKNLYGHEGMAYAFTYDFLASTPLTWTLAVAVCMKYGKAKGFKIKDSILTLIKIPPIWGLILGLIMRESIIAIPLELLIFIDHISHYVTFLMLIIVGISIRVVNPEKLKISLPAILIKVIISPLFAFLYGTLFGLSSIPLNVCVIEAIMPSMLLSMIFATVFGVDMRTAVEMIFLTTIISLSLLSILIIYL